MSITPQKISDALVSEDEGSELLDALGHLIEKWLEDGSIDNEEAREIHNLERELRRQVTEAVSVAGVDEEKLFEGYPGFAGVGFSWLMLAALVLSEEVEFNPLRVTEKFREVAGADCFISVLKLFAPHVNLQTWIPAHLLAAATFSVGEIDEWRLFLDDLREHNSDFASAVVSKNLEFKEQEKQSVAPRLSQMSSVMKNTEENDKRFFKKYFAKLNQGFLQQGYVTNFSVSDDNSKDYQLLFGDSLMAICPARGTPIYIQQDEVKSILVGSLSERVHSGYNYNDYEYWTVDIYKKSGAYWNMRVFLTSNDGDANPAREFVTSNLNKIGDYYPVASSGQHYTSETGYRTTVSYRVWY